MVLHDVSLYINTFTSMHELWLNSKAVEDNFLVIHAGQKPAHEHKHLYNAPATYEVAALIVGLEDELIERTDVILRHRTELKKEWIRKT